MYVHTYLCQLFEENLFEGISQLTAPSLIALPHSRVMPNAVVQISHTYICNLKNP